jgi:hypothetical protein
MPVTAHERHDSNPGVGAEVESGHDSRAIERRAHYGQIRRGTAVPLPAWCSASDSATVEPCTRAAANGIARGTGDGMWSAPSRREGEGQEQTQSSQRFPKQERSTGTLVFHLDADRNRSGTRTEGIAGQQFDARARILQAHSTLSPLMHNRVHRATTPPSVQRARGALRAAWNAEALGRIVARTAERERLSGNPPTLRSGQEFPASLATRISSLALAPTPPRLLC